MSAQQNQRQYPQGLQGPQYPQGPKDPRQQQRQPNNYQQQPPNLNQQNVNQNQQQRRQNPQNQYQQPIPKQQYATPQNRLQNNQPQYPQNQPQPGQNQKPFQPQNQIYTPQNYTGQQLQDQAKRPSPKKKIFPTQPQQLQQYDQKLLEGSGFDPAKYKIKEIKDGAVYRGDLPQVKTINKIEYSNQKVKTAVLYENSPPRVTQQVQELQQNQPQNRIFTPNQYDQTRFQANQQRLNPHAQSISMSPTRQLLQPQIRKNPAPTQRTSQTMSPPDRRQTLQKQYQPQPQLQQRPNGPPNVFQQQYPQQVQHGFNPQERIIYREDPYQVELVGMLEKRLKELIEENNFLQNGGQPSYPQMPELKEKITYFEDLAQINELEQKLAKQDEILRIKDLQIMDLKNQWVEQEQERKKNEEFIDILQKEIELLQNAAPQQNQQQIQEIQEQLIQRNEENNEWIKKHGKLHQDVLTHKVENDIKQNQIKELQTEKEQLLQRLQHQVEDSTNMENHYLGELERMKLEAIDAQAILMQKFEGEQKKCQAMQVHITDLEGQINFWQFEIERLQQIVQEQEAQLAQWRYKYAQFSHLEDQNFESLQLLVLCQFQMQALTKEVESTKADLDVTRKNHLQAAKDKAHNISKMLHHPE